MRWTLLTLVVLNLLYFATHFGPGADSGRDGPAGPRIVAEVDLRHAGKIRVVELLEEKRARLAAEGILPVTEAPDGFGVSDCRALGALRDLDDIRQLRLRLNPLGVESAVLRRERPSPVSDFLVYLPPEDSLDAAELRIRELEAANVEAYLIDEGPHANGVSLGVFNRAESADEMRREITNLGYEVEIEATRRMVPEYWLLVREGLRLDDFVLEQVRRTWPRLRVDAEPCRPAQALATAAPAVEAPVPREQDDAEAAPDEAVTNP